MGTYARLNAVVNAPVNAAARRMWDFGTAVVAIACQPNYGGKSYWASRIFAKNSGGLWQMMESYHTTIQASPVLTVPKGQ